MEPDHEVFQVTKSVESYGGMASPLPRVIAIEGNIGVGKSTQIARLQELFADNDRVVVLPEPVDDWVSKGFLAGMYDGSVSKGEFQHMVLMSLAGDLLNALARKPTPAVIITERSPWGNYHVFGKTNLEGKSLELYHHTWERILGGLPSQLDVKYVYLNAEVSTIVERMATRGREAESKVPREYLDLLNDKHNEWLGNMVGSSQCKIINAHHDADTVWEHLCEAIKPWFDEAGETFKKEREIKATHERERNLTIMALSTQQASEALHGQSPEARDAKRRKLESAEVQ